MTFKFEPEALKKIQYGIYIVTSFSEEIISGLLATVVFQITNNPARICTCLNKNTLTHELAMKSGAFGVSILSQEANLRFISKFGFCSGRNRDKFADVKYKKAKTGSPLVLDNATGILDLELEKTLDFDSHTLFVGKVVSSEKLNDKPAMTYDYYHDVIKGKLHKYAPSYQKD